MGLPQVVSCGGMLLWRNFSLIYRKYVICGEKRYAKCEVMACKGLDNAITTAAAQLGYPAVKDGPREAEKELL